MLKHFRSGSKRVRTLWWILTIGTVVTFIGGFVFIFGSGAGDLSRAIEIPDLVGKVAGQSIRQGELNNSLKVAQSGYASQYGTQPQGRDAVLVGEQAWTNLVAERAIGALARRLHLKVADAEVIYAAKFSPPPDITLEPAFMTNGRFDRAKWQQALADPSVDWSPLEQRMRSILPAQRLEERVIAGVKISEPELQRLFSTQYDRVQASFVLLPLDGSPIDSSQFSDAVLRKYYDEHKAEFTTPVMVKAELVQIPVTMGADEEAVARDEALSIVEQARGGSATFEALAQERSEGPYADRGGDMGQDVAVSRLPQALQAVVSGMEPGQITDPIRDGNTYFIFKLLSRNTATPAPTVRLAQIQKPIRASSENMQSDVAAIRKLRAEARKSPLADIAARRQLVSTSTEWFATGQFVPALLQMPHIQQWALAAKKGEVSRAYGTETGWIVLQVTDRREAGPRSFEDARADVRSAVELSLRQAKPRADAKRILDAVAAGQTLEQAAAAGGAVVAATDTFPRSRPHRGIEPSPRAVGLAFGLPVGRVGGPVDSPNGIYLVRKNLSVPGDPATFESIKGQLSGQILNARQQRWLRGWIESIVAETKVEDLRADVENTL